MQTNKLRLGMIGLGSMGLAHDYALQQLSDVCEVVAVCDTVEAKVTNRVNRRGIKGYQEYNELIQDPEIDSILVTVPHVSTSTSSDPHFEIVKSGLSNKKHVLVEKPVTLTFAHAQELIILAERQGVKFTTAENTRFTS